MLSFLINTQALSVRLRRRWLITLLSRLITIWILFSLKVFGIRDENKMEALGVTSFVSNKNQENKTEMLKSKKVKFCRLNVLLFFFSFIQLKDNLADPWNRWKPPGSSDSSTDGFNSDVPCRRKKYHTVDWGSERSDSAQGHHQTSQG